MNLLSKEDMLTQAQVQELTGPSDPLDLRVWHTAKHDLATLTLHVAATNHLTVPISDASIR